MEVENLLQAESQEQNEQQKQVWALLVWLKNKAADSFTNENLLALCNDELLKLEVKLYSSENNQDNALGNYDFIFSSLLNLQSFSGLHNWFDKFSEILLLLEPKERKKLVIALSDSNPRSIADYFIENWFPTNKLEFDLLSRRLAIKIDGYPANEHKESKLHNVDGANIEKLLNVYDAIQSTVDQSEVFILLKSLSEGRTEVYPKLKSLLLSQPEELEKLLNAVIDADKTNNTTNYESLKYTLLIIDPAFETVISNYENKNKEKIDSLYKTHIYSLSWTKPKLSGSLFESTNDHGDKISIDITKNPPYRTLSLAGSEYALEANRDLGELHKPNLDYEKQRQIISSQLKTVNILQTANIQEHIADLVNHEYELWEIIRHLKLAYGIDVDFINSLDELASPFNLEAKQNKLEEQLKKIESNYTNELSSAIANHRERIFEQDEKTRDVLKFISDIGLDLLPKESTDQIINEVKSWMIIVEGINLDPSRLDLKSWFFGESPTEAWTNQWKENLIMFFNKIISGSTDLPIIKEMHLWISWKVEDRTVMRHMLISNRILSSTGSFNFDKARDNLNNKIQIVD